MSVSASCRSASGRRRRPAPWLRSKGDPWTLLLGMEGSDETLATPGGGAGDRGLVCRLLGGTRLQASRGPDADGLAQWTGGKRLARRSRLVGALQGPEAPLRDQHPSGEQPGLSRGGGTVCLSTAINT